MNKLILWFVTLVLVNLVNVHAVQEPTICTMQYDPVCAEKQVQCVTTPCDPVRTTYGNACMAAADQATIIFEWDCNIAEGGIIVDNNKDDQQNAVSWAHKLWITKYNTIADFNWDELVTREQAAKMIISTIDNSWVSEWMIKQASWSCVWTDYDMIDSSLISMVKKSCTKGLFYWVNGKFMPKAYLTDTDLRTVTSRAAQHIPALMDILMRIRLAAPKDMPMTRGELLIALQALSNQITVDIITDSWSSNSTVLSWEYYLISYNGSWVTNTGITLGFSGSMMHARLCNAFNGKYTATADTITLGTMMSTKMACMSGFISDVEWAFSTIQNITYSYSNDILSFSTTSEIIGASNITWIWKKK